MMRERGGNLLFTLLALVAAALIAFFSTRFGFERDVSFGQRASLGEDSKKLLAVLDGPVEIVSYARRDGGLRNVIAAFVERYQRAKPDIALRFVDPDADPGAMREQGVRVDGELDVRYRGRSERLKVLGEAEFSNALLRLSRARERIVAFLEGEGERSPIGKANADLGQFMASLQAQGVRAVPLPLATSGKVPENVDLLVVANPQVALPKPVVDELVDYVERGGTLLWLVEPGEQAGLSALADALSVRVLGGTVVDGNGEAFGIGDPSFVAISAYPPSPIGRNFALTTLFPQPAALAQMTPARWKIEPILRSSAKSWTELGKIPKAGDAGDTIRYDAGAGEIPGPLDLGFALTRLSPRPGAREQRAVVIGDGDFLSNSFLGNGGNRELGERVFDWLLADDALIAVPSRTAPDRTLDLSQRALSLISVAFLVVVPIGLVLIGLAIRLRRKRR